MDTQNNVGEQSPSKQYLYDLDLRGRSPAEVLHRLAYLRPEGFKALLRAVAQKDRTLEDKILRSWGVWW